MHLQYSTLGNTCGGFLTRAAGNHRTTERHAEKVWAVKGSYSPNYCKENPIYVFPEKKLRGLSPIISTFMYLRAIYIVPQSVHLFSCSRIGTGRQIVGIY